MRETKELLHFARRHFSLESPHGLILCTLVEKKGSSYRTVGAQKLIELSGGSCGFLSGGCLENQIDKTARENFSQMPFQ